MADIRQYRKEKQETMKKSESEAREDDYERNLRKHRNRVLRNVIYIFCAAAIIIVIIFMTISKSSYSSYKVVTSVRRNDNGYSEYYSFGGKIIKCSRDGITAFSDNGESVWNCPYEITNLVVDYSGDYFAVADTSGNKVYTFDKNGKIAEINTAYRILQLKVSQRGYVTVILEDKDADYVNTYSVEGEKIYTIKKTISLDGVPMTVSPSPDGEKLIAAFTAIGDNEIRNNIVFYNFNEVGQNENERVVGGYDYGRTMVGKVLFLDNTNVAAIAEDKISFYTIKEYPSFVCTVEIAYEIESVFYNSSYIGLVHRDKENGKNRIQIYNANGKCVFDEYDMDEFSYYKFNGNDILMYGDTDCRIVTLKGKTIFECTFEDGLSNLVPVNGDDEFIYVNREYVGKIKLK